MNVRLRVFVSIISLMLLASLSCVYLLSDEELYYPNPEVEVSGEILEQWEATAAVSKATEAANQAATRVPRETAAAEQGQTGVCRWRNYEVSPPAATTSNPNMEIDLSGHPMSILTTLKHGVSGYPDQFFLTQHRWRFLEVMYPGKTQQLAVVLEWLNQGTADCAALVASGVTTMTVGNASLQAENLSINVKTEPDGTVTHSTPWVAPNGSIGDTFTLTVHASTGSYGTNVRYYFEYICD